jgi:hypothetical protein
MIVRGRGSFDQSLKAIEPIKYIHAFSLAPSTTVDCIREYMKRKKPETGIIEVEQLIVKSGAYASFKIGVVESMFNTWMNPDMWPPNTAINSWTFRYGRGSRGANPGSNPKVNV